MALPPNAMRVLALDLATSTGWAAGDYGEKVFSGTFRCGGPGAELGPFLAAFESRLKRLCDEFEPTHVFYEAPILVGGGKAKIVRGKLVQNQRQTSLATARKLYSLAGMTELECTKRMTPCTSVAASTVRKAICAKGWSGDAKKAVGQAIRWRGWEPKTSDEADAQAILIYAAVVLGIPAPWAGTPLEVAMRKAG